jgi:hypothetical protein
MTTTTTPMTDEQIRDLKDHADALTRAIEADFELPYNAPSAHSLAYWLRSAVGVSRQTLNAVAEVERLREENARVIKLHHPYKIYDECGHRHEATDEGVSHIDDIGFVCEDGYQHSICFHCCTNGYGDQTEVCATEHDHSTGICETRRVLDGVEVTV